MASYDITISGNDGRVGTTGTSYNTPATAGHNGQDASCDWKSQCSPASSNGHPGNPGINGTDSPQGGLNGADSPPVTLSISSLIGDFSVLATPGKGGNGGAGGNGQAGGNGGKGGTASPCPAAADCSGSDGGIGGAGGNGGNGTNGGNGGNGNLVTVTYANLHGPGTVTSTTPIPAGGNPGGAGKGGAGGTGGTPKGKNGATGKSGALGGNPGKPGTAATIKIVRNG